MDTLVILLPRGRMAVVYSDPATGTVTTNYPGLLATRFKSGVSDLDGRLFFPSAGRAFLSALYDRLFLCGYTVHWLKVSRSSLDGPPVGRG